MRRLLVVLVIGLLIAAAATAVALAGGDEAGSPPIPDPGAVDGSPRTVVTSPPLLATPAPVPSTVAGGKLLSVPPAVVSKYDPAWGMLGTLTSVTAVDDPSRSGRAAALGSFLVVGDPHHAYPDGIDRAFVTVTSDTRLFRLGDDGALVPCGFAALHEGAVVAVRFTGPVAESYPVQATAGGVVILAD